SLRKQLYELVSQKLMDSFLIEFQFTVFSKMMQRLTLTLLQVNFVHTKDNTTTILKQKIAEKMKTTYLFLFAVELSIVSCKKHIPGPQGAIGPEGEQGLAGKDGTTIGSGTTPPSSSVGKTGDFYLDLASGMLYGPKTAEGWPEPFSLKGDQGSPGNDG